MWAKGNYPEIDQRFVKVYLEMVKVESFPEKTPCPSPSVKIQVELGLDVNYNRKSKCGPSFAEAARNSNTLIKCQFGIQSSIL